ncbi:hypothetical protein Rsub_07768 [Raphidocelis subcapitata]|uniref:CBS domain-containing protein n=1 Tax=Raphidocelis subcapitata TaxID=307507 RepID=A0A2V0PBT5_9CHLO|nr:hypothetical protein Rsub_07768 [Raphidocelis subcapitata]|eukprot:GBF95340.1 hypothetical protein Rsub_07768 [Raphidocelis subcapitata]
MILSFARPLAHRVAPAACLARVATSQPPRASEPEPFSESDAEDLPRSTIGDILKTKDDPTLWIGQDSMMIDAVRKMSDENAAALLVFDPSRVHPLDGAPHSADAVVGILTERDYLHKVVVQGRSSFTTPVKDIMTRQQQVKVLTPSDSVVRAMVLMVKHDIRNVPVIDDNAMVGVLSIKDVVKALLDDQKAEIHTLKEFISGTSHNGLA